MTNEQPSLPQPESGPTVRREDILARLNRDEFMASIEELQENIGYAWENSEGRPLSQEPLLELDAMMHLPGDIEVVVTGGFRLVESDDASDSSTAIDGDIIGDGHPRRLFDEQEPVMLIDAPLLFSGAQYSWDRDGKCQIVFGFYTEGEQDDVSYEATFGDLWALEEVIEEVTEWTEAINRINSQVLPMASNDAFLAADRAWQESILNEQCFDAQAELEELITAAIPVAISCVQYFEVKPGQAAAGERIDQSDVPIDERVVIEGVIEDVVYPELFYGDLKQPLRSLDDFTYGDGAPCLLVLGSLEGEGIYYLVPTHVICSLDQQS